MAKMSENEMKSQVLTGQMNYLCEELGDPGRYFPYLRSKGILDNEDCQRIRSEITSQAKTESFVETISRGRQSGRGEHPFDVLVDALKKQRVQAHIARQLQKALARIKSDKEKEKGLETRKTPLMKDVDGSSEQTPPTISNTSVNTNRESYEVHPDIGPLPPTASLPSQPPQLPSTENDGTHVSAEFGPLPTNPPPTTSRGTVEAQQVTNAHIDNVGSMEIGRFPPSITKTTESELGPQSQPSTANLKSFTASEASMNFEEQLHSNFSFDTVTTASYQSTMSQPDSIIAQLQRDNRNLEVKLGVANEENKMQAIRIHHLENELRSVEREKIELQDRIRVMAESSGRPASLPMHHKTSSPILGTKYSPLTSYEDPSHVRPVKHQSQVPVSTLSTYYSPHSMMEHRLSASSAEHGNECTSLKSANSNSSINSYGSKNSYTHSASASESLV